MNRSQTERSSTPYIAVAAHFYGTGTSLQESRKNLVKAGGSSQEEQVVYKLPVGATGAYVAHDGNVYWYDAEGEMKPVFRYMNGKAVAWKMGEDKPVPYRTPPEGKKGQPRHAPDAQEEGSVFPEPNIEQESEIAAGPAQVKETKPKTAPNKHAKKLKELEAQRAAAAKDEPAENHASTEMTQVGPKPNAKKAKPSTDVPAGSQAAVEDGKDVADFLLFIGGNFYTKESFIQEAKTLGVSRRMPSHHLPKGVVCGKSRVFLAAEGGRKADGSTPVSEVFGYFVPSRVEFIALGNKTYTDIVGELKLRDDAKVIDSIESEPARHCGTRKEGGTYIVVDKADSPIHVLKKVAQYEGNHFRGMMRLDVDMSKTFLDGGLVSVLINEHCMKCNSPMKCSPDGHARAERERRRIAKGEEPKWLLLDSKCQKEVRAARANDDGPEAAVEETNEQEDDGNPILGTN